MPEKRLFEPFSASPAVLACCCWWLTGLPGAGKSTLAMALAEALRQRGEAVCVLDGDELRLGLCSDLGFGANDRLENMRRTAEIARLLNANRIHAIAALVSPLQAGRDAARRIVGSAQFFEVHVATPLAVCQFRDPKGLYARARLEPGLGLTGVQAAYEVPEAPNLLLNTSYTNVADDVAQLLALRQPHKP